MMKANKLSPNTLSYKTDCKSTSSCRYDFILSTLKKIYIPVNFISLSKNMKAP